MKKLLIALVASVAVSTGFAKLTDTQSFETSFSDFVADVEDQDDSQLVDYNNDGPSFSAPYDFADFGFKYLSLDTGDATLWRTNEGDAAYFDMVMQFNPSASAPELDEDTKIAIYLNSASNIVVLAGDGVGGTQTNVTETTLVPGTWSRLTIASVTDGFKVTLNTNTVVGTFASRKDGDATIKSIGFKGSGALDDFVARTSDPFGTAATIGGETYASLEQALSEAEAGDTVTLLANATAAGNAISTAAATLDLNGKTLTLPQNSSKVASLTFTGTGAATLKGGDLTGVYHELTITAPAGANLTFDGMTFHASVKPAGSGALFTVTNCQFLCDCDKTGAAFTDGSSADVHSYGVLFFGDSKFTQADIVNNYFDQGRRAAVQASFAGDLYFYGNTVVADKLTSRKDGATTRYPALQIFSNGRVFMENNTFSGQYLGEAFCMYAKEAYRFSDEAIVFNGNTVSNGVNYLWGVYDVDATGVVAVAEANVLFGANTIGDQVDLTKCSYKTTIDDAPYGPTPATLALPAGVDSVYAWTHADGAKDFYVNGTPADAIAAGTVIAVPGVAVADVGLLKVTPDTPLKNQYSVAELNWASYLGTAVDGAYEIDDLAELKAFQANVGTLATAGETFKLTADIALDEAWEGIGIKAGKDLVNGANTKDIPTYVAGAFCGTFDGQNHTISNFQMENGTDYGAFFNSVNGATISNLKISFKEDKLCANSSATGGDTGATFVGVARGSTLQNLTALAGTVTTVSASKDMGGIVGYLMAGSTVDSCTNELNLASLLTAKARKSGGIALITQDGQDGAVTATISNCKNCGTVTLANAGGQSGGIVGYVGTNTTIVACENTAAVRMVTHMNGTITLSGVNKGNATVASCNKAIDGLNFAIVDGDVATFVADNALAAGNIYKVMAPGAATYEFVAAGTIAFNTALAAPASTNITADTATLVLADPVTEGTVTTYAATAGVASVDDFAYATFEDALAALKAGGTTDDFVTLLADATYAFSAGTRLKVKTGTHTFTPVTPADVILTSVTDEHDVMTYTAVEGVASVYHAGTNTWYATFADAYDAAHAIDWGDYPTLTVKVGSDFTPEITYSQFFQKITFVSTTEDPITVNLKNAAGTYTMTAVGYQASANVTLVLPTDFTAVNNAYLTGGCTVEVPEGVTLTLASGSSGTLSNIGGLVGAGTLVAPTDAGALGNFIASDKYSAWLKAATWTGTLQCSGNAQSVSFANIANADASLRFCGFTNNIHNAVSTSGFKSVEVVGDGLTLDGNYQSGTYTFSAPLTGTGRLYVNVIDSSNGTALKHALFSGDVSGFAGSIAIDTNANCSVSFGSSVVCAGKNQIGVQGGKSVTVAEGETWAASDFIFPGLVTLNGTLVDIDDAGVGKVWNNADGAVLTVNTANAFKFGNTGSWVGTYNVNFDNAAAGNAFAMPQNAKATNVINGVNGVFKGYPTTGTGAPTVEGPITLNADWTIGDGYPGPANKTTFAKLSGDGSLTTCTKTVSSTVYYEFTELYNYTNGVITVSTGTDVTIGRVNVDTTPANNSRVVKITTEGTGVCNDDVPLYVNGVDSGATLTYDADGADGAGLYLVSSSTPLTPGEDDGKTYTSAEAATNAAAKVGIGATTAVENAVGAAGLDDYLAKFEGKVVDNGDGTFKVVVGLTAEAAADLSADATTNVLVTVAASLPDIIADAATEQTEVTVSNVVPGFYYSISYGTEVGKMNTEGERVLATASGTIKLQTPAKAENATAGFYKVNVNPTDK